MSSIEQEIKKVAEMVDEFILSNINGEPLKLYEATLHYIKSGGKRLRPFLVVKCCELCNGSIDKALPIASAIEMVHNFTLVHDDIMDNDEFRHGVPTVHRYYGLPYGILAGDLLLIEAFNTVVKHGKSVGLDDSVITRLIGTLAKACKELSEGQALDMEYAESKVFPEQEHYIRMISKKTASLFEASCILGAVTAYADDNTIDKLASYGRSIGLAFQLIDDLIGVIGDSRVTKKPVGNDIREGKKTLPILLALKKGNDTQREKILSILGAKYVEESDILYAIDTLTRLGIEKDVRIVAEGYITHAIKSLEGLSIYDNNSIKAKEALIALTRFIVERSR
jgi:geranylgeranyl diphosphate synthase type I